MVLYRYFLEIAYCGAAYSGWQRQKNATSVQASIEFCLEKLLQAPTEIMGSGRTDAGVHATQQFAHFDTIKPIAEQTKFLHRLNAFLPSDIAIRNIYAVATDAHARFDAKSRTYRYEIVLEKPIFNADNVYYLTKKVDFNLMQQAAIFFEGRQNFQSFSKVHTEVNHFYCEVYRSEWEQVSLSHWVYHVCANRFLRGMVRALVGTMLDIGKGKTSLEDIKNILETQDRRAAGAAAPAKGLTLSSVNYEFLPPI
ncbi:MAG: tRNA pseudouridine(38-40) synthase TruA [Bernardetiaceae bacterium]|nr:tRNA pseudouridine(38-40) synthase TruA [Bernardetiaceae bacterium]